MSGGSLFVSSELLNMLLHVTPGRWLKGEFVPGERVRPGRSSGENGEVCTYIRSY